MNWLGYLRPPWATRRDLSQLWDAVTAEVEATTRSLLEMRKHMASTDELVARFAEATDEIASDLSALRDEVAGLDGSIAAKFEPLVSRLEGLGANPADPVPAPVEDAPADESDEPGPVA